MSEIRTAAPDDAARIAEIYNWYVENTWISFEEAPVSELEIRDRMQRTGSARPWFVLQQEGRVMGFAYGGEFRSRTAYRFSVETTIYIDRQLLGQGAGTRLYNRLIDSLRDADVHVLLAAIALPNPASVALHEKLGYRKIGQLLQVGRKFDQWIDVGYWQLLL